MGILIRPVAQVVAHNDLGARGSADAHPVAAVTGLEAHLEAIDLSIAGAVNYGTRIGEAETDIVNIQNEQSTQNTTLGTHTTQIGDRYTKGQVDGITSALVAGEIVNRNFGFKNKLINGCFRNWNRGTAQTTVQGCGSADRFSFGTGGSTQYISRQSFTPGQTAVPGNPRYFLRNVITSVAGAGNLATIQQKIESVSSFAGETITLSFYAKADVAKNIAVEMYQHFGTGGSPSSPVSGIGVTTVALTNAFAKITVTFSIPSISGKTIGTDNNDYLALIIWLDAGSTFNSRTNSLGQQSGTFDFSQLQIESGAVATVFEDRPIGIEKELCRRYARSLVGDYRMSWRTSDLINFALGTAVAGMRTTPTIRAGMIEMTDFAVLTLTGGANIGFTLSITDKAIIASKTAHGLTDVAFQGYTNLLADAEL